jgi:NAD(P)-dependent dehydrogenase (short-subunit alcohol dehydrogenase family)
VTLAGKAVAVTGASRGIGRATSQALVEAGARVALLARDREALAETCEGLGQAALAVPTDVRDPDSVRAAFATLKHVWGALDGLVSCAAVAEPRSVEGADDAGLRREIETNLLGPILCTREAVPLLRPRGGRIVYVSSDAAADPFPRLAVYSASKAGLEVFARAMSDELRGDGIGVSVVRPGPTLTGFASGWDPSEAAAAIGEWVERGYVDPEAVLQPGEVANSILHALRQAPGVDVRLIDMRPMRRVSDPPGV